jgi:hypothetical protein
MAWLRLCHLKQSASGVEIMASTDSPRKKLTDMEQTLAFVIGGGLTLLIVGYGISAVGVASRSLDIMMIIGLTLAITGAIAWVIIVKPWNNFDDWSVPLYTGHDHHDSHADDLTQIDGISAKTAKVLNAVGIHSFEDLAKRKPTELDRIVRDSGLRISSRPEVWITEAQMILASGAPADHDHAQSSPAAHH